LPPCLDKLRQASDESAAEQAAWHLGAFRRKKLVFEKAAPESGRAIIDKPVGL
jgi:hypothetical protein